MAVRARRAPSPAGGPTKAEIRAEAARLLAALVARGAVAVEADLLLPADTLLDLYGEDIRARAYVTHDPLRGEMMLRPDFTVPVVQAHMQTGADPARYAYAGEVFRVGDGGSDLPSEHVQVGFEVFDRDVPRADAEVFATIAALIGRRAVRVETGDIGILTAAIRGLSTTDRRKAALLRHLWRPARFRALLDRFSGRVARTEARTRVLDRLGSAPATELIAAAGPVLGLRSAEDIAARARTLLDDAATPPLAAPEAAVLYDLLGLSAPAPAALQHLRGITALLPALAPAVDRFAARLDALAASGVDVDRLPFEASHGRTTMEYYDGFVFSFWAEDAARPALASGGRYDALTALLGQGQSIPAVGGILRPGILLDTGAG